MLTVIEIVSFFILATESKSCQNIGGTLLEGDDGKSSCYLYHKGRHIYDFEASKKYCQKFGGNMVTISGPKDQANVFRMIKSGITANKNSVLNSKIKQMLEKYY